jgi:hypothetical protein
VTLRRGYVLCGVTGTRALHNSPSDPVGKTDFFSVRVRMRSSFFCLRVAIVVDDGYGVSIPLCVMASLLSMLITAIRRYDHQVFEIGGFSLSASQEKALDIVEKGTRGRPEYARRTRAAVG